MGTEKINTENEQRDIDTITAKLLSYKDKFGESAYMIGKLLLEAKGQLKENALWLDWLACRVDIPARTAQRFMRLAKGYPDPTALSDLGMTKALALLGLPEDEREAFIEETHDVNGAEKTVGEMSSRELEKAVKERKGKLNDKESPGSEFVEQSKSDNIQDSKDSESDSTPEPNNIDPVGAALGGIIHLEKVIDGILVTLAMSIDNPEDYDELNSRLRIILIETLQKLPPTTPVNEDKPA